MVAKQWVIIDDKRYNLASMKSLGLTDSNWGTGIKLEGIYLMPRSKRVIIHTYSIWENPRTHGVYGDRYHLADDTEIARLAEIFSSPKLMELVPIAEDVERGK